VSKDYEDAYDWDDAVGGGLLANYTGTVTSAEFGIDEDYNDEVVRAMFDIEVVDQPDEDIDVEPGEVLEEAFNVGNTSTWEAISKGRKVARVDGKRPKFNDASGYGRLIAVVAGKAKHLGDVDKTPFEDADKLLEVLRERGPGTNADVWEGLTFEFRRLTFSFYSKADDETIEYQRVYPVAFVGEASEGKPSKSRKSSTKRASKQDDDGDDDGPTRADLIALAAEHEQFSKFLAAAMSQWPGVEDGDLAKDLLDEKKGIFAEAHE
jgi:hypothetical protein